MSLSSSVSLVNCVCPLRWYLVTNTCLVGIDPTFIAGILLTHIFRSGRINSSQALTFSERTEATLLLGSPGREKHTGERAGVFGLHLGPYSNNEWAGYPSHECCSRDD